MTLLDEVIEASGGMARWTEVRSFTLHLSINGALLSRLGQSGRCKDMVAEGETQTQLVRFAGIGGAGASGIYSPDRVTIEDPDGAILDSWERPHPSPLSQIRAWNDLHLVFFCGFSIWNYLTTPFLLAQSDVGIEELPPWHERDQQWRRLRAIFPPRIVTHSTEQIFYFDDKGLQRRTDHELLGMRVAHYSWAHQTFCDIVVPTLRRSLQLHQNGDVISTPKLIDVEIFDVSLE
jgi:hypothetical protein